MDIILPKGYEWVDLSDEYFKDALERILKNQQNMFINGPAGTGKSVLLQLAYKMLPGNIMATASTGIAASSLTEHGIPATTIHSALGIPTLSMFTSNTKISEYHVSMLSKFDVIIIEEVSMISSSLFDHICRIIKKAEELRNGKKIRMLLFGDILQFAPVIKMDDTCKKYFQDKYDGNIYFFSTKEYNRRNFHLVNLEKIFRQKDEELQDVFNKIRIGAHDEEDLRYFDSNVCSLEKYMKEHEHFLVISTKLDRVKALNIRYGIPYGNAHKVYHAIIEGNYELSEKGSAEVVEDIYVGQQVICTANNPTGGYLNGTLGTVLLLGDDFVVIKKSDGNICTVLKYTWDQVDYKYDPETDKVVTHKKGSMRQIACKPAFAITSHKAQGLTVSGIYFDFGSGWMPEASLYVGLSRCKTKEGIGISRPLTREDVKVNEEAFLYLYENIFSE